MLPANKKLAIPLYFLKDTGSILITANVFGIEFSTASNIIHEVCKAITKHLGSTYIRLPRTEEEMSQKTSEYESKNGMIQTFGCIDGTMFQFYFLLRIPRTIIVIRRFFVNCSSSLWLQGCFYGCELQMAWLCPRCQSVLKLKISKNLQNGKLPILHQQILLGDHQNLIGDPAYLLTHYYFRGCSTCSLNAEVVFNNMLRSSRKPTECAFGRLIARRGFLRLIIRKCSSSDPFLLYFT